MKRAAIILLGFWLGCDSRNLVVITSLEPDANTNEPLADAGGPPARTNGHYHMENLDRGLVAVSMPNGVYLGWRMFGYEYDDQQPDRIAYAVYRGDELLATVLDSTNYLDSSVGPDPQASLNVQYSVAAIIDGETQELSRVVTPWPQDYLRIPLVVPPAGVTPATCPTPNEHYTYSASDASVGDLDGDGRYEIVLKWDPSNARDNSQGGCTGDVFLDAYNLDGQQLWRIDLGPNIRAGAHYTQHLVYDFDGDGKAEVVVKTAPGTIDGTGTNLQTGAAAPDDQTVVYRNPSGYILTGPEYLTVFDGVSGAELATVSFQPARGAVADWGDTYGNRVDNLLSTAAFVRSQADGTASGRPSIIMGRGFYARTAISAWNWRDGALTLLWTADSRLGTAYSGQGAHSWAVADVDGDGTQEIITGSSTINGDGTRRCSTNLGYGLGLHVADLIPGRSGLEVFVPHMNGATAYDEHDANTCAVIVAGPTVSSTSRGVADDIYDGNDGGEMWTNNSGSLISATTGKSVGSLPSSDNFVIWWDADEARELEDQTSITKYGGATPLLTCIDCASNNSTKATPALSADLLGDWREEIIWREKDNSALRLYTTTDVTTRRIYTLMHDPQYRMQVSSEQAGFNQPPHPSFHIGHNMLMPPKPDIFVRR
jgi:hypothetical protein